MRSPTIIIVFLVSLLLPLCVAAQVPRSKPVTGNKKPVIDRLPKVVKSMPGAKRNTRSRSISKPGCDLSIEEALLVAELRAAIEKLRERRIRLDAREAALKALQAQVQSELEQLRKTQEELKKVFVKKDDEKSTKEKKEAEAKAKEVKALAKEKARARTARIAQLAKILKKMKPEEASRIIAQTPEDIAVEALSAVGDRAAGKILGKLPADKASALMKSLVEQPLRKEKP